MRAGMINHESTWLGPILTWPIKLIIFYTMQPDSHTQLHADDKLITFNKITCECVKVIWDWN